MYKYPKNFVMALLPWIFICFVIASSVQCKSMLLKLGKSSAALVKRDVELLSDTPAGVPSSSAIKPDIYSFTVTSNIAYRYATTTVTNRMANPANTSKELSFTVTLPDSAFISKFLMVIKDKTYEAYVKEKEEARRDYQEAVSRGETAGHVELSARDSNLFTVSVNVEAHNKVTFNLTYEQLLTRTLGQYENFINVNPGQIVKDFKVNVNIEESAPITSLEVSDLKTSNEINAADSKSIDARIERPTKNTGKVMWNPDSEQQRQLSENGAQGQLIVRYDIDRSAVSSQIFVDEGYFVHFFAPANLNTLNKHVLFALDISGSMGGRKIEQLREALEFILSDISEKDFFSLILFSDSVQLWSLEGTFGDASPSWSYDEVTTVKSPVEINQRFIIPAKKENIEKAKAFAKSLNETGGTNIIAALRQSLQIANWGQKTYKLEAKPLIIFLTDGQPNVDESDPEKIVKLMTEQNSEKYPLFSLGFGDGADFNFLRKLSLSNGGFARNIYVASDTSLQLKNFYREIASPLLSNVSFAYIPGQIDENTLTKSVFNNLFNGSELVVAGKLTANSKLSGNLTGTAYEGYFCEVMPHEIPLNKTTGHLEKLWAYLYIKELLDKDFISNEKNSLSKQKALNLSLHYGFVTPLTSLVVVKPNESTVENHVPVEAQTESPHLLSSNSFTVAIKSPLALNGPPQVSYGIGAHPLPSAWASSGNYVSSNFYSSSGALSSNFYPPGHGHKAHHHKLSYGNRNQKPQLQQADVSISSATLLEASYDSLNVTPPEHLNISDIIWLHNKTEVTFPSSNNSYSIFSDDAPDTEFQSCVVPNSNNTFSHCRHLAHCVIPEIVKLFEDFVPYGETCVIDARFVGICCPPAHVSQKVNSTTVPSSSNYDYV